MTTFYDLKADLPKGEKYDFATLKGKVVLVVNTASAWYVVHSAKVLAVV
jgi:glutathione peroxidase-family protein